MRRYDVKASMRCCSRRTRTNKKRRGTFRIPRLESAEAEVLDRLQAGVEFVYEKFDDQAVVGVAAVKLLPPLIKATVMPCPANKAMFAVTAAGSPVASQFAVFAR
jgi:hypothetical protein